MTNIIPQADDNRLDIIGCWIDGAVPRSTEERIRKLYQLLLLIDNDPKHWGPLFDLDQIIRFTESEADSLYQIESDLLDTISFNLPDGLSLVCDAGDVIITDDSEDD